MRFKWKRSKTITLNFEPLFWKNEHCNRSGKKMTTTWRVLWDKNRKIPLKPLKIHRSTFWLSSVLDLTKVRYETQEIKCHGFCDNNTCLVQGKQSQTCEKSFSGDALLMAYMDHDRLIQKGLFSWGEMFRKDLVFGG